MGDARDASGLPDILKPENLPPEFATLNAEAREEIALGEVSDLGNAPCEVGVVQAPRPLQAQTTAPVVNALAWMRDITPLAGEDGLPAELRDTSPSGQVSQVPIEEGEALLRHRQSGVSPGNAEAEDPDWDHLGG
ncbi:MAG TPA: hypothetical protein V6D00_03175 [Pantanalinema sp.]